MPPKKRTTSKAMVPLPNNIGEIERLLEILRKEGATRKAAVTVAFDKFVEMNAADAYRQAMANIPKEFHQIALKAYVQVSTREAHGEQEEEEEDVNDENAENEFLYGDDEPENAPEDSSVQSDEEEVGDELATTSDQRDHPMSSSEAKIPQQPHLGGIEETAKRPREQVLNSFLQTPFGNMKFPNVIKPKCKVAAEGSASVFRKPRAEECFFSIDGSPMVLPENKSAPLDAKDIGRIQKILSANESTLSPDTRKIATNLRSLLQKKFEEDDLVTKNVH